MICKSKRITFVFIIFSMILLHCSGANNSQQKKLSSFHLRLANNYFFDRNVPMALKELDTAIKLDPTNYRAHFLMGFVLMGRKDYISAIIHYKKALDLKPDYFEARENLGATYIAQENWQKAIETIKPLLYERLYTTPYLAHNNLGYAYFKLGNKTKAFYHLKNAVFLNPRFCLGFYNLGKVYFQYGSISFAEKNFKKAIKKCPSYPDPYYMLGIIANKKKKFKMAENYFQKCVKFGGESQIAERCMIRLEGANSNAK